MAAVPYEKLIETLRRGEWNESRTDAFDPLASACSHPCGNKRSEAELSQRIHQPCPGQRRVKRERAKVQCAERDCWHCSGVGVCSCIVCTETLQPGERGQCLVCHGSGKVIAWVQ